MESINIPGFDARVDTWSGGVERVLQTQRVAVCCRVIGIRLYKIRWWNMERHLYGWW